MLQIQKMLKGEQKQKSEITEKDHLKRRVTFRCGWDDIGGNRMKLVSYKTESERPGVQPSGDWQEPRRKRKGHWSWDKWFGNKEQKREQVQEKMQDSIEERAWAEHLVLMEWPWKEAGGIWGASRPGFKPDSAIHLVCDVHRPFPLSAPQFTGL